MKCKNKVITNKHPRDVEQLVMGVVEGTLKLNGCRFETLRILKNPAMGMVGVAQAGCDPQVTLMA